MEFKYCIGGSAPHMKKFIVDAAAAVVAGVPVQSNADAADGDGVINVTTTAAVGVVGLTVDAADASTNAQVAAGAGDQSDGNNASFASVIINPDAVYSAKLNNGGTEDTALAVISAAQAASSAGTTITGGTDEFTVWAYSGANVGHERRFTGAALVAVAFPKAIAALDEFVETSTVVAEMTQWPTLSTAFTQIDATAAVAASNDNFIVVEHLLRDKADDGLNNSFALIMAASHAFNQNGTLNS